MQLYSGLSSMGTKLVMEPWPAIDASRERKEDDESFIRSMFRTGTVSLRNCVSLEKVIGETRMGQSITGKRYAHLRSRCRTQQPRFFLI